MNPKEFLEQARENTKQFTDFLIMLVVIAMGCLLIEDVTFSRQLAMGVLTIILVVIFILNRSLVNAEKEARFNDGIREIVNEILDEREAT